MCHVARDEIRERANAEGIPACDAATHPCDAWKVTKKLDRGVSHRSEFVDMRMPRSVVGCGRRNRDILIEARQRTVKPSRKPERAKDKQPLAIVDVTEHLADGPLACRISME